MKHTDREYADFAGRHSFGDNDAPRQSQNKATGQTRQQDLADAGARSKEDVAAITYEVRTAQDTQCFLCGNKSEEYANDRMNWYHIASFEKPHRSTSYPNNHPERTPTERLHRRAEREREANNAPAIIREGGSQALEQDRAPLSREEVMAASKQMFIERNMNDKYQEQQQAVERGQGYEAGASVGGSYAPLSDFGEPASDMSREDRMAASKEEFIGRSEAEHDAPSVDVERGGGIERE